MVYRAKMMGAMAAFYTLGASAAVASVWIEYGAHDGLVATAFACAIPAWVALVLACE